MGEKRWCMWPLSSKSCYKWVNWWYDCASIMYDKKMMLHAKKKVINGFLRAVCNGSIVYISVCKSIWGVNVGKSTIWQKGYAVYIPEVLLHFICREWLLNLNKRCYCWLQLSKYRCRFALVDAIVCKVAIFFIEMLKLLNFFKDILPQLLGNLESFIQRILDLLGWK